MLVYWLYLGTSADPIVFDDYASLAYYLTNTLPSGTPCTVQVYSLMPQMQWAYNVPGGQQIPSQVHAKTPTEYTQTHYKQ